MHFGRSLETAYYEDTGEKAPAWPFSVAVVDESKTTLATFDPRTSEGIHHALLQAIDVMARTRPSKIRLTE